MVRFLILLAVLCGLPRGAHAQTGETTEIAVNGPEGAVLSLDGRRVGTLPLASNLSVQAGSHRFRLEVGQQKFDSEGLSLPANRQAELNLSVSGRTLVAVLRITPGVLLFIGEAGGADGAGGANGVPGPLRDSLTAAAAAGVRQEHALLLGSDKQDAIRSNNPALLDCVERADCHKPMLQDGQVAYVLSLRIERAPSGGSGPCVLRAALLDARTRDFSARAEARLPSCSPDELARRTTPLAARLLSETAVRPRGTLSATSEPSGAKVLVDERWLGTTPLQQELFTGPHAVEFQRRRYLPQASRIRVDVGQNVDLRAVLQPDPAAQLSRPLWRIVTGSILLGGGLVMTGFGAAALHANGQCQDGSSNVDTCTPYYDTTRIGGGLLGGGLALTLAGAIVLAIPSSTPSR